MADYTRPEEHPVPPVPEGPVMPRPARNPGARAGLILIVIGLVVLAAQFIPGLAWWTLWPLIIVIAGAVQAVTPDKDGWDVERLFDGLSTVAFGLFLLAITTGIVGWGVFWELARFWPVLIIALGLNLLGKGLNSSWIRALGSVAIIATLAYVIAVEASGLDARGLWMGRAASESSAVDISEPVDETEQATLEMDTGMVDLSVSGGAELVELTGTSPWGEPTVSVDRSGSDADVTLSMGEDTRGLVFPGDGDADLDLKVSQDVVWDMRIKAGVANLDIDLSDVPVQTFDLQPGVADCTIRFGDVPDSEPGRISLQSGVSSVKIEIPEGIEARVRSESGLTGHDIADEFESQGSGVWETAGFAQAEATGDAVWLIDIKSGIGSIVVDTY